MKTDYIVYVLTFLSAVVVVLTRVRLSQREAAGQHQVGMGAVNAHTVCGALAVVLWVVFLFARTDLLGIVALAFYWVTAVAGLLILLRWLPTRGKHASDGQEDSWSDGPGLSVLAHVGMAVGVLVFSWFYVSR